MLADGAREICHIRHTITALHAKERLRSANHGTTLKGHNTKKGRRPTLKLWLRTGILAEKRQPEPSRRDPIMSDTAEHLSTFRDINQEHT